MLYTATMPPSVRDEQHYFNEGKKEALDFMRPALDRLAFNPRGKRILDIGCGLGRLFPGFSALGFGEILGIDVSPEMIKRGQRSCPVPGARFIVGTGEDLGGVDSDSIDYCFSYVTFQHVPRLPVIWSYLQEIRRVLRSGGTFQLHFRGKYPLKARVGFLLPKSLRPIAQASYRILSLRWLRGQPIRVAREPGSPDTLWGVAVPPRRVTQRLSELGFSHIDFLPDSESETRYWAIGKKP